MESFDVTKQVSRRSVVKTGAKLAYAVPLVAASFKLNLHGALAAVCPADTTHIPDANGGPGSCCYCDCTSWDVVLLPEGPTCWDRTFNYDAGCLVCDGLIQSLPA